LQGPRGAAWWRPAGGISIDGQARVERAGAPVPAHPEGLRGHHPLFDPEHIREAFAIADRAIAREDADDVGEVLLSICRDPLDVARIAVDGLAPEARLSLIRLYFRLLDRAEQERGHTH
jgi:hypothetical protein